MKRMNTINKRQVVYGAVVVVALVAIILVFGHGAGTPGASPTGTSGIASSAPYYAPPVGPSGRIVAPLTPKPSAVTPPPGGAPAATVMPGPGTPAAAPKTYTVTYTDSGFSPSVVTIKKGDTVVFKNESTTSFWPASDPHPLHNGYPTTGGCIGSTFDACAYIPPGGQWSFLFQFIGSWGYHDHLSPRQGGTVVVTQ